MMMLMAQAFMFLAVPMVVSALFLAGTDSKASGVYMEKAQAHYREAACVEMENQGRWGIYQLDGWEIQAIAPGICNVVKED